MPTPSVPTHPKLTKAYRLAVQEGRPLVKKTGDKWSGVYWTMPMGRRTIRLPYLNRLPTCCGITELNLVDISRNFDAIPENQQKAAVAIAIALQFSGYRDRRVVIVGIPVTVKPGSAYNIKHYEAIMKILEEFGFKKMTPEAYLNKNSNNKIDVLYCQV